MKNLNLFFFITIILFSCNNKKNTPPLAAEEKAKKSISEYLQKRLAKMDAYEAISWGTLDSTYTAPSKDTTDYLMDKADEYIALAEKYLPSDFKRSGMYSDTSIYYSKRVQEYLKHFKKKFTGWKMQHQYKYPEADSQKTYHYIFYFDTAFIVLNAVDISESN